MSAEIARAEFELVHWRYMGGTSKLYSRGDFLPVDDDRAMSEGDFLGRLRALFGEVECENYVLRHRATGFVITAYSAQSGPSYGGGPRYPTELPDTPPTSVAEVRAASGDDPRLRLDADRELAAGGPVDWSTIDPDALAPDELLELRTKEHAYHRRWADVAVPPGFAAVASRLDELVSAIAPADWEAARYSDEGPTIFRVGARNGKAFCDTLAVPEALAVLIAAAEQGAQLADADGGWYPADDQLLRYWQIHHVLGREQYRDVADAVALWRTAKAALAAALPRVQAAWFRTVDASHTRADERRRRQALERAEGMRKLLRIDRARADAALLAAAQRATAAP